MLFHHVLDEVFSKWSQLAVLRVLQDPANGISGREIARLSQISPKQALIALSKLEDLGIINRQRGGRDHLFSLNTKHILVKEGILPLLRLERDYPGILLKEIKKKLAKHTVSLILFGSVARKEESISSDIDVCLIVDSVEHKRIAEEIINSFANNLNSQYTAKISPIYFTIKEFLIKFQKNQPPVNFIKKEGILFSGKSIREITNGQKNNKSAYS